MKTFVSILAVFALVLLLSLVVFAEEDEEKYPNFEGSLYFQSFFVSQHNFSPAKGIFGNSMTADSGNFNSEVDKDFDQVVESRMRVFLTGNVTPHIRGRFTLEINPEYGREQGFGDFRVNNQSSGTGELRIKHFYVEMDHSLAGTFGYRIGRQGFATPESLIVGDPDAEGMTVWWDNKKAGKFTVAAAVVDTDDSHEIEDIYGHFRYDLPQVTFGLKVILYSSMLVIRDLTAGDENPYNSAPAINAGGTDDISSFLMGPSDLETPSGSRANLYWAGLEATRTLGGFETQLDFIYSFGNLDQSDDMDTNLKKVQGYLGLLDLSYGRSFFRVGAAAAYVSGHDPDPESSIYTGYVDINAGFSFTRFFFGGAPYLVTSGFASPSVQGSGLIAGKGYVYTNPFYWMDLNFQVATLSANTYRPRMETDDQAYRDYETDAGRYYGTELDLWAVFKPADPINWLVEFDYFLPGSYFKGTGDDEDPGNGFLANPDPAYRIAAGIIFQ